MAFNRVGDCHGGWRAIAIFLPRFSSTYGSVRFKSGMMRSGVIVLVPAACLLLSIFFNQRAMLATPYDARFAVSNETAALFLFADGMALERTALLYLVSYLVYLGFNAAALLYSSRNPTVVQRKTGRE